METSRPPLSASATPFVYPAAPYLSIPIPVLDQPSDCGVSSAPAYSDDPEIEAVEAAAPVLAHDKRSHVLPDNPERFEAVVELLFAADALASKRISRWPLDQEEARLYCNECQRVALGRKALDHAQSCHAGRVLAAIGRVMAAYSLSQSPSNGNDERSASEETVPTAPPPPGGALGALHGDRFPRISEMGRAK